MENKASDFVKDDKHKNQLQLIEPNFIMGVGEVLTQGVKKYSRDNWKTAEHDEAQDRYMGAILRHIMAYKSGEEFDKESGRLSDKTLKSTSGKPIEFGQCVGYYLFFILYVYRNNVES